MKSFYQFFDLVSDDDKYIKGHKIRNLPIKDNKELDKKLIIYNELVYELYKLKINNSDNLEEISRKEIEILEYINKYNIKNIDKIEANLLAITRYYDELENGEVVQLDKKRGITIYEDLYYKLYKLKMNGNGNVERQKKLEKKISDCSSKYNLDSIEKIEAKIRAIVKYNNALALKEENKKRGLELYQELVVELHNLKYGNINEIESKLRKCSNKYNLSNLEKIEIQLKVLEENS